MTRFLTFICFFLLLGSAANAQELRGKITDSANNPISDAHIYTSYGDSHNHSNAFGKFTLKDIKSGDTIYISFVGFKTLTEVVKEEDFDQEAWYILKEEFFDLDQVNITNSLKNVSIVTSIDLRTDPVSSSQEVLRRVPGLFIGQHAGGGKAEQIFLRGFDIDHGTDIALTVDGMPVNMVSHAHGQGYADLHFLIPETIETIDFGKGPYYSDKGNFNTAGYVDFRTKHKLEQSSVGLEYGQFNTSRIYGLFDLLGKTEKQHAYIAAEYLLTDGPVESPQNFNRINIMGKYSLHFDNNDRLSASISRFQSKWDASGQIPQRLVDQGVITRFGAVDNTEGGNTSRTNVKLEHTRVIDKSSFVRTDAFYSYYDFELYSNFTFFLENPDRGDQIRQKESRHIFGFSSTLFDSYSFEDFELEMSYGIGFRYDDVNNNELSRSANRRETLDRLALGQVDETNFYGFINAELDFGKWMINPGLRLDAFKFDYVNQLSPVYDSRSEDKAIVSPKLNIIYNPGRKWQLYFKSGVGFHSNDTRVVVARGGEEILPAAYGADLGAIWKPFPRLWINTAIWYLFLEQEFVYVGDAAIVEPSGKTERQGVDFGIRYQLANHLFFDSDLNYTYARSTEEDEGADYIPLAPDLTASGGFSYKHPGGFNAGLRYRYIKDRPANEDNSIVAEGYFIVDANASYTFKNITLGVAIENLLDQDWNEAQFATESQLRGEQEPVEELHFTPGVPFFAKGTLRYNF